MKEGKKSADNSIETISLSLGRRPDSRENSERDARTS